MPRVEKDAEVTLVVLVYRSLKWLDFVMGGADSSKNETRYRWLVVANDATPKVLADPRISVDFQNEDLNAHYLRRVYAAWREGVLLSKTQWVILANTDMRMSDHAIDELVACKKANPRSIPCGLLVENGRIPSGMPEYVKDFGTTPGAFQYNEFIKHAAEIRKLGETEPGRLYQPCLFDRQEFFDLQGYPDGNIGGVSGDKILFERYKKAGYEWLTCLGSVTAHCQEGEMRGE